MSPKPLKNVLLTGPPGCGKKVLRRVVEALNGLRLAGFYTHATDELVLVLEGTMEFEVEDRIVRPMIGEELLIPAGAQHSARNVGSTTARWLSGYRHG